MDIKLTPSEVMQAAMAGVMRQVQNIKAGRRARYGAGNANDWQLHIQGCLGEFAVAKALGIFWSGNHGNLDAADVGDLQVRTTRYGNNPFLRLQKADNDDDVFILCSGVNDAFKLHGWMHGRDGKLDKFWGDKWNNGRKAFWVPNHLLNDMNELRREIYDVKDGDVNSRQVGTPLPEAKDYR